MVQLTSARESFHPWAPRSSRCQQRGPADMQAPISLGDAHSTKHHSGGRLLGLRSGIQWRRPDDHGALSVCSTQRQELLRSEPNVRQGHSPGQLVSRLASPAKGQHCPTAVASLCP